MLRDEVDPEMRRRPNEPWPVTPQRAPRGKVEVTDRRCWVADPGTRDRDRARRCELVIAAENAASIRVAEKCGYRFAGMRRSFVEVTGQAYEDLVCVPSWFEVSDVC